MDAYGRAAGSGRNNRTGTAAWQRTRRRLVNNARGEGLRNCPLCGVAFNFDSTERPPNSPEVDHIVPASLGGGDDDGNLRVICRRCNQRKGNRTTPTPTGYAPLENPFPWSRDW